MKFQLLAATLLTLSAMPLKAETLEQAQSAMAKQQYGSAQNILQTLIKNKPQEAELHQLLALAYLRSGDYDEAEESIQLALEYAPNNEDYWLLAAGIYGTQAQDSNIFSAMGYAKDAKKALDKAHKINPKNPETLMGLIQFNLQAPGIAGGDEDEVPTLMKLLENERPDMAVAMRALLLLEDDKQSEAEKLYQDSLKSMPDSLFLNFTYGIYQNNQKQYQEAINSLKFVIQQDLSALEEGDMDLSFQRQALYQLAKASGISGLETKQALKSIYAYMDLKPEHQDVPEAWQRFRLGQILFHQKQKDYALAQFEIVEKMELEDRLEEQLEKFKEKHQL